jgi:predicted AAA+ superfamily ATPase
VPSTGPRFENLVALHLLKLCHLLQDLEGFDVELHYLRDRTGREVDFLVTADRKPWFAVEAKTGGTDIDPSLVYYQEKLKIPWVYQVVLEASRDFTQNGVRCLPARRFLAGLI